jgi:hypothetical protein
MAKVIIKSRKTVVNTEEVECPDLVYKFDGAGFHKVTLVDGIPKIKSIFFNEKRNFGTMMTQGPDKLLEVLPLADCTAGQYKDCLVQIQAVVNNFLSEES